MGEDAFQLALDFTLPAEGGFVDNPNDSGGATNHGVTQKVYDAFRQSLDLPTQSVKLITDQEVRLIYSHGYWLASHADKMEYHLGICHFDTAVNAGIHEATLILQRALGLVDDGIFGPHTMFAAANASVSACSDYISYRKKFYTSLVAATPQNAEFLPGWIKRCDQLQAYIQTV